MQHSCSIILQGATPASREQKLLQGRASARAVLCMHAMQQLYPSFQVMLQCAPFADDLGKAEVSKADEALRIQQDVLGFQVPGACEMAA